MLYQLSYTPIKTRIYSLKSAKGKAVFSVLFFIQGG